MLLGKPAFIEEVTAKKLDIWFDDAVRAGHVEVIVYRRAGVGWGYLCAQDANEEVSMSWGSETSQLTEMTSGCLESAIERDVHFEPGVRGSFLACWSVELWDTLDHGDLGHRCMAA